MVTASVPLWALWNFEPLPVLGLAALAGVYLYALGPLRRALPAPTPVRKLQVVAFAAGVASLAVALCSPLDTLGMHYLLTAHMVQHVIFSVVAPPLLLLGTPGWMLEPLFRHAAARRVGRILGHPFAAFALYNLNMWLWHVPALLDATVPLGVADGMLLLDGAALVVAVLALCLVFLPRQFARRTRTAVGAAAALGLATVVALSAAGLFGVAPWAVSTQPHNPLHTLMDATFIATALLYWLPILSPVPEVPRISPVFGMFYMFISTQPMMALGALIVFSSQPLYALYAQAPLLLGFTRLGDQQMAGLIMWLIMDIPLLLTISLLFFRWMNAQERAEREAAGEIDELAWEQHP